MKFAPLGLCFLGLCPLCPALAQPVPDTLLITGPQNYSVPAGKIYVTPLNGTVETLAQALQTFSTSNPTFTGTVHIQGGLNLESLSGAFTLVSDTSKGGSGDVFFGLPLATNLFRITGAGTPIIDVNTGLTNSTNIYNSLYLAPGGGSPVPGENGFNMNDTWTGSATSFSANVLQMVDNTQTTGNGGASVLSVNMISSSNQAKGVKNAMNVSFNMTGASGNTTNTSYAAMNVAANTTSSDGGSATGFGGPGGGLGSLFAMNPVASLGSSVQYWAGLEAAEFDVLAPSGSSTNIKHGVSIVQIGGDYAQGAWFDAALDFGRANTQASGTGWKNGILFGTPAGYFPFDPANGTMIGAGPVSSGTMLAKNGMDFHLVTFSGNFLQSQGFTVDGTGNTSANSYAINTFPVLNLYADQSSPIISPETANAPLATGIYIPRSYVIGYANTVSSSTPATYESMLTSNITLSGTGTNHYGMLEESANVAGTGTLNAELNVQKNYITLASASTISGGAEQFEAMMDNQGTISGTNANYTAAMNNNSGGTMGTGIGYQASAKNNGTNGAFGTWIGFACFTPTGSGTITNHQCLYNEDIGGEVINAGHWASRPDSGQPTYSTGCTASGRANDAWGLVTESASTTTCTVTFKKPYSSSNMCFALALTNNPVTGVTQGSTSFTWTNASSGSTQTYLYACQDGY